MAQRSVHRACRQPRPHMRHASCKLAGLFTASYHSGAFSSMDQFGCQNFRRGVGDHHRRRSTRAHALGSNVVRDGRARRHRSAGSVRSPHSCARSPDRLRVLSCDRTHHGVRRTAADERVRRMPPYGTAGEPDVRARAREPRVSPADSLAPRQYAAGFRILQSLDSRRERRWLRDLPRPRRPNGTCVASHLALHGMVPRLSSGSGAASAPAIGDHDDGMGRRPHRRVSRFARRAAHA